MFQYSSSGDWPWKQFQQIVEKCLEKYWHHEVVVWLDDDVINYPIAFWMKEALLIIMLSLVG